MAEPAPGDDIGRHHAIVARHRYPLADRTADASEVAVSCTCAPDSFALSGVMIAYSSRRSVCGNGWRLAGASPFPAAEQGATIGAALDGMQCRRYHHSIVDCDKRFVVAHLSPTASHEHDAGHPRPHRGSSSVGDRQRRVTKTT